MLLALHDSTLGISSFAQFLTVIIIFLMVLALCYFTTRWVAGYQKGKMLSGNINVLETFRVTNSKYIQIIKIGDKIFAVAYSKDSVALLGELNEDSLTFDGELSQIPTPVGDFKSIFNKVKNANTKEESLDNNGPSTEEEKKDLDKFL